MFSTIFIVEILHTFISVNILILLLPIKPFDLEIPYGKIFYTDIIR